MNPRLHPSALLLLMVPGVQGAPFTVRLPPVPSVAPAFVARLAAGQPQVLVLYGTSLTASGAWVKMLDDELARRFPNLATVINSGANSQWSGWGRENLAERVLAHEPDTVIMEFSINDAYEPYKTSVDQARANLLDMISRVQAGHPHTDVILQVMNPCLAEHAAKRPNLDAYNEMVRELARERGLLCIDHAAAWQEVLGSDDGELFRKYVPDGLHPHADGCRQLILPNLIRALGLDGFDADLEVPDTKGSYVIPYIQSERRLEVNVDFGGGNVDRAELLLQGSGESSRKAVVEGNNSAAAFTDLEAGEFELRVTGLDAEGRAAGAWRYTRIGVGAVIAALGDSITEGYYGLGYHRNLDGLRSGDFPAEAVSRDGRNFPQYSPTTSYHKPEVNCFASWMPALNDHLTAAWNQPVFIANEGWGGYTSGAYLNLMRTPNWQGRMKMLRPAVWLVHLGVNDERHGVSAEEFGENMDSIISALLKDYGASPTQILVARPNYDYAPNAAERLATYIPVIDALVTRHGLAAGPDFFAAYSKDRKRWYGSDPVHPNVAGVERMARLWADALVGALPKGPTP